MTESAIPNPRSTFRNPNWLQVSLTVCGELAEAVAEALRPYAHQGVVLESDAPDTDADLDRPVAPSSNAPVRVRAFVALHGDAEQSQLAIGRDLWPLQMIAREAGMDLPVPEFVPLPSTDWQQVWKAHYRPLRVGEHLVVVPAWEQPELRPDDVPLVIDPGQAFGTGTHPSTQLCLAAIERHVRPGGRMLDLGCGSGILSIAAVKLGAARADGLDTDADAVRATHENAVANGVSEMIRPAQGSLPAALKGDPYDLVVANILSGVLIQMLDDGLARTVRPDGTLILAGILAEQSSGVETAVRGAGMRVVSRETSGDWVAVIARS